MRWNGREKQLVLPDTGSAHIWSSATLYTDDVIAQREKALQQFLHLNPQPGSKAILRFHQTNNNDEENGFMIKRKNGIQTLSVTQVAIKENSCAMNYYDCIRQRESTTSFHFKNNSIEQV